MLWWVVTIALLAATVGLVLATAPTGEAHPGFGGAAFDGRGVLEAEDHTAPWRPAGRSHACDPTADGEHSEPRAASSRSAGYAVFIPNHDCGIRFEALHFPTGGQWNRFAAAMTGTNEDVDLRVDVYVDDRLRATADFTTNATMGYQDIPFRTVDPVPAGTYDVDVHFQVLDGPTWINLVVDCFKFEETDTGSCLLRSPIASFGWAPVFPCHDRPVTFEDRSVAPSKSWLTRADWDFGDAAGTTLVPWGRSVTHTYTHWGTFPVTLEVTTDQNETARATQNITVRDCRPPPVADFTCRTMEDPYREVRFQDLSSSPEAELTDRKWHFGDGATSREQDPVHQYPSKGAYQVTLQVWQEGGLQGSKVRTCTAHDNLPPVLDPIGDRTVHEGQTLRFQVTGRDPDGDPVAFSFQPGTLGDEVAYKDQTFTWRTAEGSAGTYPEVRFAIQELTEDARVDEETITIQVLPLPPVPGPRQSDTDGDGSPDRHDPCPADGPEGCAGDLGPPAAIGTGPDGVDCQDPHVHDVEARWDDGVDVTWHFSSACPVTAFLVWNGTHGHLVAEVPHEPGTSAYLLRVPEPWQEPHRYWIQPVGTDDRQDLQVLLASPSNLVMPPSCTDCGPDGAPGDAGPAAAQIRPKGPAVGAGSAVPALPAVAVAILAVAVLGLLSAWRLRKD